MLADAPTAPGFRSAPYADPPPPCDAKNTIKPSCTLDITIPAKLAAHKLFQNDGGIKSSLRLYEYDDHSTQVSKFNTANDSDSWPASRELSNTVHHASGHETSFSQAEMEKALFAKRTDDMKGDAK